jgi:hypothetical protein
MRGVADGAGVPYSGVRNVNLVADFIKAQCTVVGANGPATPAGGLVHMRTLDGMGGATMPIK